MTNNLEQMAQTCVTAAHLINIDEEELELIQSDRCKYGDLTADEIDSLQSLYKQAIESLNDELASLCGQDYNCGDLGYVSYQELYCGVVSHA
ncbi:MAG: hypothetical protein WCQ26_04610 [Pseudanabaena sp. ELA748]